MPRNKSSDNFSDITIVRANFDHIEKLLILSRHTFIESHGHSAPDQDIRTYVDRNLNLNKLREEINDPNNFFSLLFLNKVLVGYSKIIFNTTYNSETPANSSKLERLYLLQKFHGMHLGKKLMDVNIQLAKENKQTGIWLYVWTENEKAIRFYTKYSFQQIATTSFKISEQHKNPNHILFSSFNQQKKSSPNLEED